LSMALVGDDPAMPQQRVPAHKIDNLLVARGLVRVLRLCLRRRNILQSAGS
jgi:hypothetical protein